MALLVLWIIVSSGIAVVHGGCNQKHVAKPNEVTYITSPGYPGNFTQYVDCYYELYTSSENRGLVVYVDVVDVTLSCDDETIQLHVYDGFSRDPRFLGQICDGGQTTFESPKQTLYLTFRSRAKHAVRSRGFRLRVRTEPKYCHCYNQETMVLDVTSTPALLTSPFYPYGTEANVNCRWLLKAPEDSRVNVTLLHSDMRGSSDCHNFGLYVFDGKTTYDDKMLASVCDNSLRSFQSSGPFLLLVFNSGSMVYRSGGGVKLRYSTVPADGAEDGQLIGQTLFFVITALLVVVIIAISLLAALKLFLLPRRRKREERRRRASRARLTSVSHNYHCSRQSEGSQSRSESRRHASCSRASSSASGSSVSVSSQWSGLSTSLSRLLSLYGLKKTRQEQTSSPGRRAPSSECLYSGQRSGVIIRVPDYCTCEVSGCYGSDLPPPYEEVMRQSGVTGLGQGTPQGEDSVQCVQGRETLLQSTMGEAMGLNGLGEAIGQSALEEVIGQSVLGEALGQSVLEEPMGQQSGLGEAVGQGVQGEAVGQGTLGEITGQGDLEGAEGQSTLEHVIGQRALRIEALGVRNTTQGEPMGQNTMEKSTTPGEACVTTSTTTATFPLGTSATQDSVSHGPKTTSADDDCAKSAEFESESATGQC